MGSYYEYQKIFLPSKGVLECYLSKSLLYHTAIIKTKLRPLIGSGQTVHHTLSLYF